MVFVLRGAFGRGLGRFGNVGKVMHRFDSYEDITLLFMTALFYKRTVKRLIRGEAFISRGGVGTFSGAAFYATCLSSKAVCAVHSVAVDSLEGVSHVIFGPAKDSLTILHRGGPMTVFSFHSEGGGLFRLGRGEGKLGRGPLMLTVYCKDSTHGFVMSGSLKRVIICSAGRCLPRTCVRKSTPTASLTLDSGGCFVTSTMKGRIIV